MNAPLQVNVNVPEILKCPVCGGIYSHARRATTRIGTCQFEGGGQYPGTEVVGCTDYRRDALCVEFDGECGHVFQVVFQQNKGNTYVSVEHLEGVMNEWLPRES